MRTAVFHFFINFLIKTLPHDRYLSARDGTLYGTQSSSLAGRVLMNFHPRRHDIRHSYYGPGLGTTMTIITCHRIEPFLWRGWRLPRWADGFWTRFLFFSISNTNRLKTHADSPWTATVFRSVVVRLRIGCPGRLPVRFRCVQVFWTRTAYGQSVPPTPEIFHIFFSTTRPLFMTDERTA